MDEKPGRPIATAALTLELNAIQANGDPIWRTAHALAKLIDAAAAASPRDEPASTLEIRA